MTAQTIWTSSGFGSGSAVLGQSLRLVIAGVALGVLGSWALTRFLSGMLFGVTPTDTLTFILASLGFVAIALLASYGPARRAAQIDTIESLRLE